MKEDIKPTQLWQFEYGCQKYVVQFPASLTSRQVADRVVEKFRSHVVTSLVPHDPALLPDGE